MAILRALVRVAGGVGGRSRIFQSGVEGGEVHGPVRAEVLNHPAGHGVDLGVGVVGARNQQIGDLEPQPRLVLEVLERLEHRLQPPGADPPVEVLGEPLEIDVGGIHVPVELDPRLGPDVAGRDRDGLDTDLGTGLRDIDGVLHKRSPDRCR
jgi:hypothetical protein